MECTICSIKFKSSVNYEKHLKTERHKQRSSDTPPPKYSCKCGKSYAYHQSLYLHRKSCQLHQQDKQTISDVQLLKAEFEKETTILKEKLEAQRIEYEKDREELKIQIALLLEQNATTNSNSHNRNTTTIETQNNIENQNIETQNNVIVVNSFGNENTDYLTDRIVTALIKNGPCTCLPKIIEKIHFDPNHPENHNIKVTNRKNNYAKIIKDNKWVTTNKKRAIDTMIQNGYEILEEKYQDNKESISEFKQERFEEFQDKYENQNRNLMRNIKDDVDIVLINGTERIYEK